MGEEFYTVVVAVSFVVILLAMGFIISIVSSKHKQGIYLREKKHMEEDFQKQLLQSQIEVQESTLSTVSKELHDNIGQLLSTAKMLLGITEINLGNPPDTLKTANETVGKAINELRSLSKSLNKEWLEKFNLIDNLTTEVNRINTANAVALHLIHPDKLFIEADKQIILFRIIQEAIQNAVKHAAAKNIRISIVQKNDVLTTSIKDDGVGFSQDEVSDGVGIINMKHRAKLLGGAVEWLSGADGSTAVITLPIQQCEQ